ncbi:MAG: Fic family protein [Deltaproteobacteria bacterium]|nr:Fic family protein [Deltaproteobacteria bacterium]MBW1859538.1 Fic family protein [Deltaproteobacteria bacterium]
MTSRIIRLIAEIDEFKGYWKGMQALSRDLLATYRVLATIESIGSSTRIEGARLSDREVSSLLKEIDIRSFRTRDEQEVAGYAKALELIQDQSEAIELTENNIKYLHKVLLQFSEKDQWHLGEYKKHPNHVAMLDAAGNEIGVIFETASPLQTPLLMTSLVERTQFFLADDDRHPLIAIADFVVRFLAIHPFQDGNGRLSRALTNLLLLRGGYEFVRYSSHERIVEGNKDKYYATLRKTQAEHLNEHEISPGWVEFFLEMLRKQKDELLAKIEREEKGRPLPELSAKILDLAREYGRVSVAFLTNALGANRNTIKKHLQQLVAKQKLVRQGKGRGTFYSPS